MGTRKLFFPTILTLLAITAVTSCQSSLQVSSQSPRTDRGTTPEWEAVAEHTAVDSNNGLFLVTEGLASYYADRFHGRMTANGERFNMDALTAAHRTLPFGTWVRVTNMENGKEVMVRINDRGPYVNGRIIDLSRGAARELGLIKPGTGEVKLEAFESNPEASFNG
ncbi:septal ring lytic transglycosylase RlpA family protein [Pelodictyon luteolum]|uniref:Probable endolytic peptidoglycan transglycosylase RlpA n=1 Tax=Chlorobium luteolum (strain DSM 273 / BCRC 81028 / 2530) TaxID=319225 RepID=Q3B1C0_CHLL3|nr:septal ring lytic transglycosylase RlpA family protein [Pelodictyon luteolum]ABB24861.1 Rare lipoprotein A [Pelodictyon luteolum DSM 273]